MRVLIALDLNDDDLTEAYGYDLTKTNLGSEWDDVIASLDARLEEAGYFGSANAPVRGRIVSVGDVTGILKDFLDAAEVGAEGRDDEAAFLGVLGTVETMRQHADV